MKFWYTVVALLLFANSLLLAEESPRKWKDTSGKFEIEATMTKVTDTTVDLLKSDGLTVTVPLISLSEADQQYVLKATKTEPKNPFAGGIRVPKSASDTGVVVELPSEGTVIKIAGDDPLPPIAVDPAPATFALKPFSMLLEKTDPYTKLSSAILIDPKTPTFGVSIHRKGNNVNPAEFGRIYLAKPGGKSTPVLDLTDTLKLHDHHLASGRSLVGVGVDALSERGGDLALMEGLADEKPKIIGRWHLPKWETPGFKPKIEFAKLLDAERALVQVNTSIYLWNLTTGELKFTIERVAAGAKICISGGGMFLAIPGSRRCDIVDINSANWLGSITFPQTTAPQVAFSPSGKQLALTGSNQFMVWDVEKAEVIHQATIAHNVGDLLGWVDDNYLLTSRAGVISPQLGYTLWVYDLPTRGKAVAINGGALLVHTDFRTGASFTAIGVPHDSVKKVEEKLAAGEDEMLLLKPGSEVSLKIEAIEGVDKELMKSALQKAVEKAGWKVSDKSPIQLVANIGRGDERTLNFRKLGRGIRNTEEVKITPFTASLQVRSADKVLWERKSTNMVPSFLRLPQGTSLKDMVKSYEKADPSYFERLQMPPRLLRPEFARNVGRSKLEDGSWKDR